MSNRKWLSMLLSLTLVFSLVQSVLPVATAANADTYTSEALTLNGEATEWQVIGTVPATFGDNTGPTRFEYWDEAAMDFELKHEVNGLTKGYYEVSIELFSENVTPGGNAELYAVSSEGTFSTPIVYSGSSWNTPATLSLKNIEVGENGQLLLGIKMLSSSGHYGYVRNMLLTEMAPVDHYTSNALTINGQAVTWTVNGERPETFGDNSDPTRFEYWSAEPMDFELQHEENGVDEGSYKLQFEVFSSDATTGAEAYVYATTSKGHYSIPITYTGSQWTSPASLSLNGIEVGSDGSILYGIKMVSGADHYGYIRDLQLIEGLPLEKVGVRPNSAILRPGHTVQLTVDSLPAQSVSFSTSNSAVAVVSEEGLIEATGDGEAIITTTIEEQDEVIATANTEIYVSSTLQSNYAPVQIEPVAALEGNQRSDFAMGADISMLDALSAIDRKYYSEAGEEKPLLELLQENGVNWIRLRAWVDPADEHGNPYGAGNIDTEALVRMASQVKATNMNLLVDLHYSDFWTDPGRQSMPKSWVKDTEEQTIADLEQEVYNYTYNTLQALYDENAYPDMIQIGNEINGGMLWPYGNSAQKAKPYLQQGIQAVRDFEQAVSGEHIDIVIHRANPGDGLSRLTSFYSTYADLDYDVIGLSYYPFWHGSLSNLQQVMDSLAEQFDKEIAIVETSYAYTLEAPIHNGATGHIFGEAQQNASGYLATPQGQANAIRDVIAAVAAVPDNKGIGIFYWEPAWLMGTDTGWATTYAASYQKEEISSDGGSGWGNQALFNYFGEALPSLSLFQDVRASEDDYIPPTIVAVDDIELTTSQGVNVNLPSQVEALFSDDTFRKVAVLNWTPASYDYNTAGQYELIGTLQGDETIKATVTVRPKNYVINPSIEDSDMSAWQLVNASRSTDASFTGQYSIHFWNQSSLTAKQSITDLPNGIYELSAQTRIGIEGDPIASSSVLYAETNTETYATPLEVTGWDKWKKIVVTDIEVSNGELEVGVLVNEAIGDYGDFDDWELIRIGDLTEPEPEPSPPIKPTPTPKGDSTSSATPAPVLSKGNVDGLTVLTANVDNKLNEFSIPLAELAGQQNAVIVLNWGELTLSIPVAEIVQLEALSTGNVIISKTEQATTIHFKGGTVTNFSSPVIWQITIPTEDGSKTLDVPFSITTQSLHKLAESDQYPASSIALYKVDEDGQLIYVKGLGTGQGESDLSDIELSTGLLYVVASVTRSFTDVSEQSDALRRLVAAGLIEGDQNGAVNLQQQATRAEVSKLTAMLLNIVEGVEDGQQSSATSAKSFADLPANHWAKGYIDSLTASRVMFGVSEQSFAPNETMSYEALHVIITRILRLPLAQDPAAGSIQASSWAKSSIAAVKAAGLVSEDEGVDYTKPLTRAQLITLFDAILNYLD